MSPKEKHVPDDAQRTSVCLTAGDRAAIRWISEVRKAAENNRTTINDILVDALWYYLDKVEGKTREQIRAMLPPTPPQAPAQSSKIAQMPRPKKKR